MNIKYLMIVVVCLCASVLCENDKIVFNDVDEEEDDGYYWRDYNGVVPKDAVPGGKSLDGKTLYIGQVLHKEQLIPARIDTEPKLVTYEWGYQEFIATENIKVLCSKNPDNFHWFSTKFNTFLNDAKGRNLVPGGYEVNANLYIGRKMVDDEIAVGKVISTKLQTTLNTTKKGKGYQHGEFDVLEYNRTTTPSFEMRTGSAGSTPCNTKLLTMNIFNTPQ